MGLGAIRENLTSFESSSFSPNHKLISNFSQLQKQPSLQRKYVPWHGPRNTRQITQPRTWSWWRRRQWNHWSLQPRRKVFSIVFLTLNLFRIQIKLNIPALAVVQLDHVNHPKPPMNRRMKHQNVAITMNAIAIEIAVIGIATVTVTIDLVIKTKILSLDVCSIQVFFCLRYIITPGSMIGIIWDFFFFFIILLNPNTQKKHFYIFAKFNSLFTRQIFWLTSEMCEIWKDRITCLVERENVGTWNFNSRKFIQLMDMFVTKNLFERNHQSWISNREPDVKTVWFYCR